MSIVDDSKSFTREQYEKAVIDYYSTPAGQAFLEARVEQQMETVDLPGGQVVNVGEFKSATAAYREKLMRAYKESVHEGDTKHSFNSESVQRDSFSANETPVSELYSDELLASYKEECASALDSLENDKFSSITYYTSSGASHMNTFLNADYQEAKKAGLKIPEKRLMQHINNLSDLIKASRREKPITVFRGISGQNAEILFGDKFKWDMSVEDTYSLARESFVSGERLQMDAFCSTSLNPRKASSFASSRIVYEFRTDEALPVGSVSAWGVTEQEYVLDHDSTYIVGDVYLRDDGFRNNGSRPVVVVQLQRERS